MDTKKIAVITLMKNHSDLTMKLINSIIEKDDYPKDKLTIYVADTGSDDEEKKIMHDFIDNVPMDVVYIEYDYYNFAKINNDVVTNEIDDDTDLILLINNDVELINNAISRAVKTFESEDNVGTVGAMLLYPDGKVQHGGIFLMYDGNGTPQLTHCLLNKEYNKELMNGEYYTLGNTGAFMLTSLKNWINVGGGLNTAYKHCFEDVEFNVNLLKKGYKNITNYDALAYHRESSTRHQEKCLSDFQMVRRALRHPKVKKINENLYTKKVRLKNSMF